MNSIWSKYYLLWETGKVWEDVLTHTPVCFTRMCESLSSLSLCDFCILTTTKCRMWWICRLHLTVWKCTSSHSLMQQCMHLATQNGCFIRIKVDDKIKCWLSLLIFCKVLYKEILFLFHYLILILLVHVTGFLPISLLAISCFISSELGCCFHCRLIFY